MPENELENFHLLELYLRRVRLTEESTELIRLRVAMRIVDRVYDRVYERVTAANFPLFMHRQLMQRKEAGFPHPLAEEIEDVLVHWASPKGYSELYKKARTFLSRRVIRKVRYGGRRG